MGQTGVGGSDIPKDVVEQKKEKGGEENVQGGNEKRIKAG
jgi:hypothetical protein